MIRLLMLAVLLAGCSPKPGIKPVLDPVDLRCHPACAEPCSLSARWDPLDPSNPAAWDQLVTEVLVPLATQLKVCETRRASCAACLDRGRQLNIIR